MTLTPLGFGLFLGGILAWISTVLFTRYRRATRIVATVAGWVAAVGFAIMIADSI